MVALAKRSVGVQPLLQRDSTRRSGDGSIEAQREPWLTGALACRCSAETNVHKALVRVHIGTFRSGRVLGTRLQTSGTPYRDGAANS